jgi:hypothetical protein
VKDVLPILAAGGTFGACALLGLLAGILVAFRLGSQLWVFGGLMAGMAIGAYGAVRLLMRSQ